MEKAASGCGVEKGPKVSAMGTEENVDLISEVRPR